MTRSPTFREPMPRRGERLAHLDAELASWLAEESSALDQGDHRAWLDLLDEDFRYEVPVPLLREDPALPRHSETAVLFEATKKIFELKFGRTGRLEAWSERPAAVVRHFLGATRVFASDVPGAVRVDTGVLVAGNRGGPDTTLVTAARHDLIRTAAPRTRLLRRRVLLDVEVATHEQLSIVF